jgi:BioD-like phosphotransacetylase family protein
MTPMLNFYIVSSGSAGKTALCSALGRKLLEKGRRTGYLKPLAIGAGGPPDLRDALTMKAALELAEAPETLSPITLTKEELSKDLTGNLPTLPHYIMEDFKTAAEGKEAMVLEGVEVGADPGLDKAATLCAEAFNAQAIVVAAWSAGLTAGKLAAAGKLFGPRFLGAVVTDVPALKLEKTAAALKDACAKENVKLLGVLPEDRTLLGVTVADVAAAVEGKVLFGTDKMLDGVVENIMLGALTPDSGLDYFKLKPHKAVVVRADRPDLALAALQTSTACVVLTGADKVLPIVTAEAENRRLPVLATLKDTPAVITALEGALNAARFRGQRKIDRMDDLTGRYLDWNAALGA